MAQNSLNTANASLFYNVHIFMQIDIGDNIETLSLGPRMRYKPKAFIQDVYYIHFYTEKEKKMQENGMQMQEKRQVDDEEEMHHEISSKRKNKREVIE